jgi:hypothetical protein
VVRNPQFFDAKSCNRVTPGRRPPLKSSSGAVPLEDDYDSEYRYSGLHMTVRFSGTGNLAARAARHGGSRFEIEPAHGASRIHARS